MCSGYLSSDRKLKIHHTLKASSSEMSRFLLLMCFDADRVQHILFSSMKSKLGWICHSNIKNDSNLI